MFVCLQSTLQGVDDLAISNVVGSNIFNTMVVLGMSALIIPLQVKSRLIRRDFPLLLAISLVTWGMTSSGKITWQSGLSLLTILIMNLIWEVRSANESELDGEAKFDPNFSQNCIF